MFPCRRRTSSIARAILAATLLWAGAFASAQSVYRVVAADGHITYTDQPAVASPPQVGASQAMSVANALAGNTVISSRFAAAVDAKEAARRLKQAQLKRSQAERLLPGEHFLNPGESAQHNRYWRRQERLRVEVEHARRRFNEARR